MKSVNVDVDASSVMKSVAIHVRLTGVARLRLRLWVGMRLLRLASKVLGCSIEVME